MILLVSQGIIPTGSVRNMNELKPNEYLIKQIYDHSRNCKFRKGKWCIKYVDRNEQEKCDFFDDNSKCPECELI